MNTLESELCYMEKIPYYFDRLQACRTVLEKWSETHQTVSSFVKGDLSPKKFVIQATPLLKVFIPHWINGNDKKVYGELTQIVDLKDNLENHVTVFGNPFGMAFVLGLLTPTFAAAASYYSGGEVDYYVVVQTGAYGAKLGALIGTGISVWRSIELVKAREQASHIESIIQEVNPQPDNYQL
ncbi:hypothetical protein HYW20_05730 [Candidatus Woesearchaeota archaeon]|nr:hypothetical protein [Candidatus Woesearchaeota archaeon]